MSTGRPKIASVMTLIRAHAQAGDFVVLPHAELRRGERKISVPDIAHVLLNGERDPVHDEFKEEFQSWNYAVRGKTIDGRSIRIAVTFDENEMLIVTVIPLGKRRL